MSNIIIEALGVKGPSEESFGTEVYLIKVLSRNSKSSLDIKSDADGFSVKSKVAVGKYFDIQSALFSTRGTVQHRAIEPPLYYFVSHSWSGMVRIFGLGYDLTVDLYSKETKVVVLDLHTGELKECTDAEIEEVFANDKVIVAADNIETRLRALGENVTLSFPKGTQRVLIIAAGTGPEDKDLLDLTSIELVENCTIRRLGNVTPIIVDGEAEIELPLGRKGWVTLETKADLQPFSIKCDGEEYLATVSAQSDKRVFYMESDLTGQSLPVKRSVNDTYGYGVFVPQFDPGKPLALYVPRWKGVAMSTIGLFKQSMAMPSSSSVHPSTITAVDIARYSEILLDTGVTHFVVSGGDLFWLDVIRYVKSKRPEVRFDLLWHSNYLQMGEQHDWSTLTMWLKAHNDKLVSRVAVVKEGMDTFLRGHGVDAIFIPNIVNMSPLSNVKKDAPSTIGLWMSGSSEYRKPVAPSIVALAMLGSHHLKASGLGEEGVELTKSLGMKVHEVWATPISREELHRQISASMATLYVTVSECSPMLPLESFALGVPCLVGPSSHLFRHDPYLSEMLIVNDPLNPVAIRNKLEGVLRDYQEVLSAFAGYEKQERLDAAAAIERFIN